MVFSRSRSLPAAALLLCLPLAVPASAHEPAAQKAAPAATRPATPLIPEAALPLDPRFSPERVKADVTFLADDLLEGRDTGSPGYEIAARYVAQRFAALGLKPMGDDGDWFQRITFQKTERLDAPSGVTVTGPAGSATFSHGINALVSVNANEPRLDVTAPLVFVGYGMVDKRLGLDDYAGLDVRGKIVVLLRGFPENLPSEPAAYVVSAKAEVAQAHGAIGLIQIDTDASARQRPWQRRLLLSSQPSFTWVGPDGVPFDETPGIRVGASLDSKGAAALFAGAPRSLAQVLREAARRGARPKGFALKTSARIFGQSRSSRVTSPNVVAMIPGGDPALADEYVILSGHLDHIGISPAMPGDPADKDRINNGALDNAAGIATLLEVAHVMSQEATDKGGTKPRRSVIFLASTGEEKGLLGADYYARHASVPVSKIVGNVDLDMPVLTYAFTDLTAYGAEHSTLGKLTAEAVAPMKLALAPDPIPEETVFVRSDHYMFVKQGVPAVFLATGFGNGGEAAYNHYNEQNYHQPGDDLKQPIIWRAGARFAEANYRITRAMADADMPPRWLKGDFFGDLFAPNAPKAEAAN
ncbi:MAG TPA: M28 family metallopeptidase [Sphingobium sp.]|nr:M28 family metallopeptidase [Sphingobium sp.]